MQDLKSRIKKYVEDEKKLCFDVYTIDTHVENIIEFCLRTILEKYNQIEMLELVYTSIKELAINGSKANIKRILFDEYGIDYSTDEGQTYGLNLFKKKLSEKFMVEYGEKARQQGLSIKIKLDFNKDRIICIVINNVHMYETEDKRIRQKFYRSSKYDDIVQFYLEYGDETEGAGLGITLVSMLLKNSNMDSHLFTMYKYDGETRAKLEIPLTSEYKSSRTQFDSDYNL